MSKLTVTDILNDIEFEIAQGSIYSNKLGEAIQSVRLFQNQFRSDAFKSIKLTDKHREIFGKQFQVIDMLLNLLQEMNTQVQTLQLSIQQLQQLPADVLHPSGTPPAAEVSTTDTAQNKSPLPVVVNETVGSHSADEVKAVMQPEAINIELQTRPVQLPIIGWFITKLRVFYQRPALFYTQLFANRQTQVNRVLGDHILYLETRLNTQQQQIQELQRQAILVKSEINE